MKRLVIINPTSKRGKSSKVFQRMQKKLHNLLGSFDVYQTKFPKDCTDRVRNCIIKKEYDQILIAGGDGTINEAVNGYFQNGNLIQSEIPIGIINMGTGGDFIKTVRRKSPDYHQALKNNTYIKADCGSTYTKHDPKPNYFINISSIGLAGDINYQLKESKFQYGMAAYFYHTLTVLLKYQPPKCNIRIKGENGWTEVNADLINFFVCNGMYNGGGMNWAPLAGIDTHQFELVLIPKIPKHKLILDSYKVYIGKVAKMIGVQQFSGSEVRIASQGYLSQEYDGEIKLFDKSLKDQEIIFQLIPSAIPIVV